MVRPTVVALSALIIFLLIWTWNWRRSPTRAAETAKAMIEFSPNGIR